jgi:hypothetical protein
MLTLRLVWNKELLFVGGFLARATYEIEMTRLKDLCNGAKLPEAGSEIADMLIQQSLHCLKFFTFHRSSPSQDVSSLLEAAFFSCADTNKFPLYSTVGIRSASEIRLPDSTFTEFLKNLPTVPQSLMDGARPMITALQNRGLIKTITFDDVLNELRSRPLSSTEMVACLKWWVGLHKSGTNTNLVPIRRELVNAAVLVVDAGKPMERIIPLNIIKTFLTTRSCIPADGPFPDHLLPFEISKGFSSDALNNSLEWTELTVLQWLEHVCSPEARTANAEFDLTMSAPWAERVINCLSRAWPSTNSAMKTSIVQLLSEITCIPTSGGLKKPKEAYFANVNVFRDLPIVTFSSNAPIKGALERILQDLGVRAFNNLTYNKSAQAYLYP